MKKSLLAITMIVTTQVSIAQLTQVNEPAIGTDIVLLLCDSNTTNYVSVIGENVTWDYTNLASYPGETRLVSMDDPSSTLNAADFTSSEKALTVEGLLTTYFTSTATERVSQGFVFTEASAGTIVAKWNTNEAQLLAYPFAFGNSTIDTYSGTVNALGNDLAATGSINASIDATGTINFPFTSVSNVIRLKTVDNATAPTIIGDVTIDRTQFEYYDLANENLPILIHTQIVLTSIAFPEPLVSNLVLSKYSGLTVGVEEQSATKFSMFPNPANESLTINGDFEDATVSIFNALGQEVVSMDLTAGQTIDISSLDAGFYSVKLESNGSVSVKNLAVK